MHGEKMIHVSVTKICKMKSQIVFFFLITNLLVASCQNTNSQNLTSNRLTAQLEKAEKSKEITRIKQLFVEEAILFFPDAMPVAGREAIVSVYEFLWSRPSGLTESYQPKSTIEENGQMKERGDYIFRDKNDKLDTLPYEAIIIQEAGLKKIKQLAFGLDSTQIKLPEFIKPTGKFKVGRTIRFLNRQESDNDRMLSFEIWYPAQPTTDLRTTYQSKDVVKAAADFLGWPLFFNSYAAIMKSNSYANVPIFPDDNFPVLIYNHGYGGFSSVYQSVFEDLSSHGYVVISLGHEYESALLLKENGEVIVNDPTIDFYAKRAGELNGEEIGRWQAIILNSDEVDQNRKAYEQLIELSPLHNESTRLWATDTRAVISMIKKLNKTDLLLKGIFDEKTFGVFGHSVGGAVAGQLAFDDNDVKAGINLDGFQFGDLINRNLEIPFMFVSGNPEGGTYLRGAAFMEQSVSDCYHVAVDGFSHESFTDLAYFNPGGQKVIELQRILIRSFFDKYLKNVDVDLVSIRDQFPGVKIRKN